MTLTEFLLARIAEDEEEAQSQRDMDLRHQRASEDWARYIIDPAECTARRRVVELHHDRTPANIITEHIQDNEDWTATCAECSCYTDCVVELPCPTLRLLALPYTNHPDYQEDWRP